MNKESLKKRLWCRWVNFYHPFYIWYVFDWPRKKKWQKLFAIVTKDYKKLYKLRIEL